MKTKLQCYAIRTDFHIIHDMEKLEPMVTEMGCHQKAVMFAHLANRAVNIKLIKNMIKISYNPKSKMVYMIFHTIDSRRIYILIDRYGSDDVEQIYNEPLWTDIYLEE